MWPVEAKLLIPGINDTWNDFQKFCKGKLITTAHWKLAREDLRKKFNEYLANGGVAEPIPEEYRRFVSDIIVIVIFSD
jgi:hypothetical protein